MNFISHDQAKHQGTQLMQFELVGKRVSKWQQGMKIDPKEVSLRINKQTFSDWD